MLALSATYALLPKQKAPGVILTLSNVSAVTMHSATVRVTGNAYAIGDLAPGASKSITVHPRSDSDIELVFDRTRRLKIDCYLVRGDRGKIAAVVTPERVAAVKDETIHSSY
ncbi:hypothetical protein [Massilia sp. S19_KUP03_FR1]|uniref:hypothetical protein n=1 Tax=Massilia sp. S19_KUP03_FR1 TaxID=3025503 RepID=UPI002FCD14C8